MAATTYQLAALKKERFPTEWALSEGDESEVGQELRQSEDARPRGWAPVSPLEPIGRPACETNPQCSIVGPSSRAGNTLGSGNHSSAGCMWD
jgi:hypothetical protein